MTRGDAELNCLNIVRQHAAKKNPVGQYTLADRDSWFGLHYVQDIEDDLAVLGNIIMGCTPNSEPNKFPDFIFPNGFIEHFRVSVFDRKNKGFESIAKENQVRSESQKRLTIRNVAELDADCDKQLVVSHEITQYSTPEQNYDTFCQSFHTHWEKHIRSLRNYKGPKNIGIFMIECPDIGFSIAEDISMDYPKPNVHVGNFQKKPEIFRGLRLSRCENLLEYMHGYCSEIQYVIYVCCEAIEIFRTDELIYIESLIKHPYLKYGCSGFQMQGNICTTTRQQKPIREE